VLRSRGVPKLQGRGRGDLRAQLVVEVPTKLADDEAALLRQLATSAARRSTRPTRGLLSRIKSAFS
jgi:molecular chaperone DnaJ